MLTQKTTTNILSWCRKGLNSGSYIRLITTTNNTRSASSSTYNQCCQYSYQSQSSRSIELISNIKNNNNNNTCTKNNNNKHSRYFTTSTSTALPPSSSQNTQQQGSFELFNSDQEFVGDGEPSHPILEKYPSPVQLTRYLSSTFVDPKTNKLDSQSLINSLKNDNVYYESPKYVYYINQWLQKIGCRDLEIYQSISEILYKSQRNKMLWHMSRALTRKRLVNIDLLTLFLKFALDTNEETKAKNFYGLLVEYKEQYKSKFTIDTYIQVVRLNRMELQKVNRIEAEVDYEGLSKWGPFNAAIIQVLVNENHNVGRAIKIYEKERQHAQLSNTKVDTSIFEAMLVGFSRIKRFDLYDQYWAEMERHGVEPTILMASSALLKIETVDQINSFYKVLTENYPKIAYNNFVLTALVNAYISRTPDYQIDTMKNFISFLFAEIIRIREPDMTKAELHKSLFDLYHNVIGICMHRKGYATWCLEEVFHLFASEHTNVEIPHHLLSKALYVSCRIRNHELLKKALEITRQRTPRLKWSIYGDTIQYLLLTGQHQEIEKIIELAESKESADVDLRLIPDLLAFFELDQARLQKYGTLFTKYLAILRATDRSLYDQSVHRIIETNLLLSRESHALKWFEENEINQSTLKTLSLFMEYYKLKGISNKEKAWAHRVKETGLRFDQKKPIDSSFGAKWYTRNLSIVGEKK
ncbi:hypothetical protein DFA_00974 [Cavenderia fasciculata]|uniref:Pentatricopeptide repeat-containing protein n=1 Tax=Cavenderia fasciculata TaxID=261658 RepID=F4PUT0_CACFS|nr:uncharacterized protein DFA_00974 [Cavenderia fasciculata]EGG21099.1 hypothetical protein DFA_00974 [Cavenderia fasciculata]|eukprot:XP_004358949.1 hypothetical protein DFA_00974 [Cavenderia fasciculata]